ncbi:FHA domain-containing protein [Mycetohabitans sp. B8]|uniref:FHA domain-containing protein n=1 Tax=Mycetohabitans sp. B8 TaxID=2841845 RepID=UPI001F21351C|nr:FHA domain-containing protein [Mycetohabitans sp. B8]
MKLLRVLTGVHAGAQVRLAPGVYRVAADDDADIRLSDWTSADLTLTVNGDNVVTATRAATNSIKVGLTSAQHPSKDGHVTGQNGSQSAAAVSDSRATEETEQVEPVLLLDFVPMQFDDTVVCIGPSDARWPPDVDLLAVLLVKPNEERQQAKRARQRKIAGITLACMAVGMTVSLAVLLTSIQDSRAARRHDIGDLAQHVNRMLSEQKLTEVHADVAGSSIRVTGMVPTAAADLAVRDLLQRTAPGIALRQYDVAEIDTRNIAESLGTSGVQVSYASNGVFDITASVADPDKLHLAIERVKRDLNGNVKMLRTHIKAIEKNPWPTEYSEMIASDSIEYAQAPDGTKHIYINAASSLEAGAVPGATNPVDNAIAASAATPPVASNQTSGIGASGVTH